ELQAGGGGGHFFLQLGDDGGDVLFPALGDGGDVFLLVASAAVVDAQAALGGAFHAARGDAVLEVVGDLFFAAVGGDVEGDLDGVGDLVGVEDDAALFVARGASGGLDERGLAAEKTFLVGVEHGDERDLGQVEAFAQEVDADEHVEVAEAEVAQDL